MSDSRASFEKTAVDNEPQCRFVSPVTARRCWLDAGHDGAHEAGSATWVGGGEPPIEEPILIRCAGSGLVGHPLDWLPRTTKSMCPVCGQVWPTFPTRSLQGVLPEHDRIDVAAMVARGDFR